MSDSLSLTAPFLFDNQPSTSTIRQIGPRPTEDDENPISKTGQIIDVDDQPHDPCEEAGKLPATDFRDRSAAADGRHLSLVQIPKLITRFAFQIPQNVGGQEASLLHRDGRRWRDLA